MEIGSTYIFDSAGPHAGAEYTLSSNDWVRTDLPMMNEVVVMPGVGQKVNDFFTNTVINPFVDVPTTLWTTTRNGYYQWWIEDVKGGSIYTDTEYNEWYSYTLGNDWSFHRNVDKYGINRNNNIESDPQRAVEIISNTASVTITTTFAVPSLQLSSKPGINLLLNFGVKNAGKGAVMYPINKGLETQR